jgi:hypothetical protein
MACRNSRRVHFPRRTSNEEDAFMGGCLDIAWSHPVGVSPDQSKGFFAKF